jgi:dihydroflavonol-4-reductase
MQGREVVFHCAGHYPRYSLDLTREVACGTRTTRNVVTAALRAGVERLVVTSSVATVGPAGPGGELSDERDAISQAARDSVYVAVKQAIETEALGATAQGLDVVVTCPTGIVGELDVKAGTGFVFVALAHGMLPFYVQGRTNLVDADDIARAHVAAAERGRTGNRYILAGHNLMVRDMLEAICDELGVRFTSWRLPLPLATVASTLAEMRCAALGRGGRPFIPREFVDVVAHGQWVDGSKAQRELGLDAATPLHVTLGKACAWYERFRYIPRRAARCDLVTTDPSPGHVTTPSGERRSSHHDKAGEALVASQRSPARRAQ